MRGWVAVALLATCAATGASRAHAADQLAIGPVPAWVRPQTPAPAGKDDGTAGKVLLADQQFRFERGGSSAFSENVLLLQTAQGLAAGNLSFAWDPATQAPTVHRLQIRRGDKVIDILASQKFTVLRREQNLESATLDGVLTATLQPEGLQVGDVLDFAVSIETHDPVLGDHVERIAGGWNGSRIGRAHLRVEWPAALPLRVRQTEGLPPLKEERHGDLRSAELAVDDLPVLIPPKGAPLRFARLRLVEFTDWRSWAGLGALMGPLYDKAAALPASGPLHDEWARMDAGAATPEAKASAMLAFVEQRVRYVALQMGAGGYVPADASVTWERRFGDCKAKTALLLALLRASRIAAVPVAVNALGGDGLDAELPAVGWFNHVLVRAEIGGRTYWLDGTRTGDTDIARLRTPDFHWGAPLMAQGGELVALRPVPLDRPDEDRRIAIDATAGLTTPARFRVEAVLRGDGGQGTGIALAALPADQRERMLRDYWRKEYSFVEPAQVDARFDPATGEEHLTMTGVATLDWNNGWYETDGTGLGYRADFHRDPGPGRDAPFAVPFPYYSRTREEITLPAGFHMELDKGKTDVDRTVAGISYRRSAELKGTVFTVEASERSLQPEFPAADAPAAQAELRRLADQNVFLRRPDDYRPTTAELDSMMKATPATASGFLDRGYTLSNAGRSKEAIADFTSAIALDPKDANPYANRAINAATLSGDTPEVQRDLAAAEAIQPRNAVALRTRGLLAVKRGDDAAVVDFMSRSLEVDPGNRYAIWHRAAALERQAKFEPALADVDSLIRQTPQDGELRLRQINLLNRLGRKDAVRSAVEAMLAANPNNGFVNVIAGRTLASLGDQAGAMAQFAKALAIKPESYIYLNRAAIRPRTDIAGRRADYAEAARLAPTDRDTIVAVADFEDENGDHAAALNHLAPIVAANPHDPQALTTLGMAQLGEGRTADADRSFAAARIGAAGDPHLLNHLCWYKATRGVALVSALQDCDAAIAKLPDAQILDSRAFVELRLGRLDAALKDYDAALAKQPGLASSLMGRSLTHARRGETEAAAADRKAAVAINAAIADFYTGLGVTAGPGATQAAQKSEPTQPEATANASPGK